MLSYWEYKSWLQQVDFTIVGSGIVGINCALALRKKFPKAKIIILERGILPQGASTKNAGFACFGSISEILDDLKTHSEEEISALIQKRWTGVQQLRNLLGDDKLQFLSLGGYEVFSEKETELYNECLEARDKINKLLLPIFGEAVFEERPNTFDFGKIQKTMLFNRFEGQLDTGEMMQGLIDLAQKQGIIVLNSITVESFEESEGHVSIQTDQFSMKSANLLIATNGFAKEILDEEVRPARAQVLITKPINDLSIQGTFHMYKGFNYFRNVENRILLGGGRHLNLDGEETTEFGHTEEIKTYLNSLLKEVILPDTAFEIDQWWSGIMGVGQKKRPIVKVVSTRVFCGVRLGGMGVAIGSAVGHELAELVS
ncbi:MAG: FAD-binding oxidoreductase [Eudoraea sp.]|nr:FAD-binding oxidoreductase [Eudoraea sp.]